MRSRGTSYSSDHTQGAKQANEEKTCKAQDSRQKCDISSATSPRKGTDNKLTDSAPDPSIRTLPARAEGDPELPTVMKVVAAGQASKEQLCAFQEHVDEATKDGKLNKR